MEIDETLKSYYKEINKWSHKDVDQNELIIKAKEGDAKAIDSLIKSNLKFVLSIAKEYQNCNVPLQDLINEGNIGLIKAIEKFDLTKDVRFISYAVWWVRQSILKHLSDHSRTIRIPITALNKLKSLNATPITDCVTINDYMKGNDVMISGSSVIDTSNAFEDSDKNSKVNAELDRILKVLEKREYDVIDKYFGLSGNDPMTLEEIGGVYGLTKVRVRQIKQNAISKLRHNSELLVCLVKDV